MCVHGQAMWWSGTARCSLQTIADAAQSTFSQQPDCLHHVIYMAVCVTQALMNAGLYKRPVPEHFPVERRA